MIHPDERPRDRGLTRVRPFDLQRTALLFVDVQKWVLDPAYHPGRPEFYEDVEAFVLPNMIRLLQVARRIGIEVSYTVVENLTKDGRDRSLDYKLSGFFVPKGSPLAHMPEPLAPGEDELVFKKTTSSLFSSTNFDYVMRNIGIDTIITVGFLTDQCIDHTIRDGADRNYYMICVHDACATDTRERHRAALNAFKGYCRIMSTDEVIAGLEEAASRAARAQ
jgi:nicotinamidase-related amidase